MKPNGFLGAKGASMFSDNYCKLNPPNQPPQAFPVPSKAGPPSLNLVDWANQYYAIGIDAVGGGIQVQSQIFQRYIQNPVLQSTVSPVRSQ